MPKKYALYLALAAALVVMAGLTAFSQEDMTFVDNSDFNDPQRPSAIFEHDIHNENAGIEECNTCHHVYDDNGQLDESDSSEGSRCSECHELKDQGRQPGLAKAFHRNCKGCHEERKQGPVMCGECHVN
jgi:hypothetical protein